VPDPPETSAWEAWHPSEVATLLAGCPVPWCVAAGWAVDLYLGRQTREHGDVEIAIPRNDFPVLRRWLTGYELYAVRDGVRGRLGELDEPDPDVRQVWLCDPVVRVWRMDTFLEPGDGLTWVSHRDARITMPMADALRRNGDGIPYLAPEIVLFTKAKHVRAKDEADLAHVLPTLDGPTRAWLADAIEMVHPEHPWVERVRRSSMEPTTD
jgi:hypothetical protein